MEPIEAPGCADRGALAIWTSRDPEHRHAEDRGQDLIAGSGRLVEAARIELASEAASRKTSTSVLPVLHLTCPAPVGADPDKPVAVLSPPDGRDARRERVSGVYAGLRSC